MTSKSLRSILQDACSEHGLDMGDLTVLSTLVDHFRLDTPAGHRDGAWAGRTFR